MKKSLSGILFLATLLFTVIIIGSGCKKSDSAATIPNIPLVVSMNIVTDVTQTTAVSGGAVTYNGNNGALTYGVCWSSTNQTPTVSDSKTADSVSSKLYSSVMTGLTAGTTYYVRAYATNKSISGGTGYGNVIKFTTNATGAQITTTVSTIAGGTTNGYLDGAGLAALFDGPQAITFNPVAGNIYIGDTFNNAIRTMTTAGTVSTLTNPALGFINGPLSTALFYGAKGVAFDAAGNAYVADMGNNVIRKITPDGVVSTFAGTGVAGYLDGAANVATFNSPQAVAVDSKGTVYVVDRGNNMIRQVTAAGVVSSLAGYPTSAGVGYIDAVGVNARFNYPVAAALSADGTKLYVADLKNTAIRILSLTDGSVTTLAGSPVQTNVVGAPSGLAFDKQGNLFIVDQGGRILEITSGNVLYSIAGSLNATGKVDGAGATARFNGPQGLTIDAQNNIYVTDFSNNAIRKIVVKVQ